MNDKNRERETLLMALKSAMKGTGLVALRDVEQEGVSGFYSGVEFEFFSCLVFVGIPDDQDIIKINIMFSPSVDQENIDVMEDLINRINSHVMDIGTFLICPECVVSLRAGIPIEGAKRLLVEQFRDALERLLHHGSSLYRWILITEELGMSPEKSMMHLVNLNSSHREKGEQDD